MSCQHIWIKSNKAYEDYRCSQCEMSLSADEYDAIQQAHRAGWEQCQREMHNLITEIASPKDCVSGYQHYITTREVIKAINAMEYKEAEKTV